MRPDPDRDRQPDWLWQERLVGLGLMVLGAAGFGLVYLFWTLGPLLPAAPPGMPRGVMPLLSPIACLVPLTAIGSSALLLLGLRRLLFPE